MQHATSNSSTSHLILLLYSLILGMQVSDTKAQQPFRGLPVVEYFDTQDYQSGIQNYAITQDYRGLMYVANNLGLLEYDGTRWRRFGVDKGTKVRAVHCHSSGRTFIGAQNEIGYFFPSDNGQLTYHSLFDRIPEEYANFNEIWNIYAIQDRLVFTGSDALFLYDIQEDTINVIGLDNAGDFSFNDRGRLAVYFQNEGIRHLNGDTWSEASFTHFFKDKLSTDLIPFDQQNSLISTYSDGLYMAAQNGSVVPWATQLVETFKKHKINKLLRLRNGTIVVGTNTNGIYMLDLKGNLVFHLTKNKGLENKTVLALYEDSFGNIWVGLNNGIAKIEWQSHFSVIDEEMGLSGTGYVAYSNNGDIYLGTNNGLFHGDVTRIAHDPLVPISTIQDQVYDIKNVGGSILVAGHSGAYEIKDQDAIPIFPRTGWWTFVETSDPQFAIGGTYSGLVLLRRSPAGWVVEKEYEGFTESSRVMEFDQNGRLWMTHGYKGVYAFDFSDDYSQILKSSYYNHDDGFPSNLLINVFKINQELVFTAQRGIYSYDALTDRFQPHRKLDSLLGGDNHIREIAEDSFGNIYFIGSHETGRLVRNAWGDFESRQESFKKIHSNLNDDLENISILDLDNILFASKNGFIHYSPSFGADLKLDLHVLIREVTIIPQDSLLFGGSFMANGRIRSSQPEGSIPFLPYRHNSISIGYSALDYNENKAIYRYMLEGFEEKWSQWTPNVSKEYTNLREGSYVFKVESTNVNGIISEATAYRFEILPPWYRSWVAFLGYIIISLAGIVTSIFLAQGKVKREKNLIINQQQREIQNRKVEIAEVSRTSKVEIQKIKNEKLRSEILHKNKELATNAMHLIDKNNFITSIKTELNEIIKVEDQMGAKGGLKRIIRNIDQNINSDDDWSQFEIHFDEVHEEFLKKLRRDHPQITPQEVKLSAYLRMNMTTKEIANLLRIGVRGVEIARYRLRKKLRLDKETNLVDFMMNY